ncbi:MAG: uracil-DNA glycosylase [Anaerolineae bacterium]|nr:uracil-DNA glycosylase [Anaerolineae bacterium]
MDELFERLVVYQGQGVFNQYRDVDPALDLPRGAEIRRQNLRRYLETFASARFVLVGEAAGYAGCRFSGIPFTCEAQWVEQERLGWTVGRGLERSSTAATPWVERSARIVWEALEGRADCVLWNAFPWHPFGERGSLSNRRPGAELAEGLTVLRCFLGHFPAARPYAVGRVAQQALAAIGITALYIRHPSHGGKRKFMDGVAALR